MGNKPIAWGGDGKAYKTECSIPNCMGTRKLLKKALDLVLRGRSARDAKTKNEAFDGLWELLVNLEYELQQKQTPSPN
jgi:hypothetical protein